MHDGDEELDRVVRDPGRRVPVPFEPVGEDRDVRRRALVEPVLASQARPFVEPRRSLKRDEDVELLRSAQCPDVTTPRLWKSSGYLWGNLEQVTSSRAGS